MVVRWVGHRGGANVIKEEELQLQLQTRDAGARVSFFFLLSSFSSVAVSSLPPHLAPRRLELRRRPLLHSVHSGIVLLMLGSAIVAVLETRRE